MARWLNGIDLEGAELKNAVIHKLASDPTTPGNGQIWYNTTTGKVKIRLSSTTLDVSDSLTLSGSSLAQVLSRANHTGTQTASTISDFGVSVNSLIAAATISASQLAAGINANKIGTGIINNNDFAGLEGWGANNVGVPINDAIINLSSEIYVLDTLKANRMSPTFIGTVTIPTAAAGTNTTQAASTAYVVGEIAARLASQDAMVYKGVINASSGTLPAAEAGWTYRVSTSGTIGGINLEVGDVLICYVDGTTAGSVLTNWNVVQTNIDGAVTLNGVQTLTNKTLNSPVFTGTPTGLSTSDITEGTNLFHTVDRAQDAAGAMLAAGPHNGISFTYNASTNVLTGTVTGQGTVKKFSSLIGDGAATNIIITQAVHTLASNSQNFVVITDASTGEIVYPDILVSPANGNVTLIFSTAPASNAYRATIIG